MDIMREWIDFERNGVMFREIRSDEPPVDRYEFEWSCRIGDTLVRGKFVVSHIIIRYSKIDFREVISKRIWAEADNLVNGPKREIERRTEYEQWKAKGIDAFA